MQVSVIFFLVISLQFFFGKYCLFRVFIGTICGIIPGFLLGGLLQALMKQNQTYFIEKHRIFP